jgi:hypothetical protein
LLETQHFLELETDEISPLISEKTLMIALAVKVDKTLAARYYDEGYQFFPRESLNFKIHKSSSKTIRSEPQIYFGTEW